MNNAPNETNSNTRNFIMPLALFALTLSAFAIGTTEFVIVGLIPTMAADLGVSLPSAGLLVSYMPLALRGCSGTYRSDR